MRACLFDIDGTLLNTGSAGQAAIERAMVDEAGVTWPPEGISTVGRTDRAIVEDLFAFSGIDPDGPAWGRVLAAYLETLPAELEQLDRTPLPGVHELLERLAARDDVVLGLLTGNFRAGAIVKLDFYGLAHYFLDDGRLRGGFGDDHRDRDDVARQALVDIEATVGRLDPESTWVIGDTPLDVRCGHAINARVLAVATGVFTIGELEAAEPGPDLAIEDLADTERVWAVLFE